MKIGQKIRFRHPSVLTGIPLILDGVIVGRGDAVKRMWPEEMSECPSDYLLVWRKDVFGNEQHFAVAPEDVIQDEVVVLKNEA